MLLKPMQYEIVEHPGIYVERRNFDGRDMWVIRDPVFRAVMDKWGGWEWEPQPSSRTIGFILRTRFNSPEAALTVFQNMHGGKKDEEVLEDVLNGTLRG